MGLFGPTFTLLDDALVVGAHSTTVYGDSIKLKGKSNFAIAIQVATSATVNLLIQFEQSWRAPTTENASDTYFVIPNGASDIAANITDTNVYIKSISPVSFEYFRLKITTGAGHLAGTISSWLGFVEDYNK